MKRTMSFWTHPSSLILHPSFHGVAQRQLSVQPVYRLSFSASISTEAFYGACPSFGFSEKAGRARSNGWVSWCGRKEKG